MLWCDLGNMRFTLKLANVNSINLFLNHYLVLLSSFWREKKLETFYVIIPVIDDRCHHSVRCHTALYDCNISVFRKSLSLIVLTCFIKPSRAKWKALWARLACNSQVYLPLPPECGLEVCITRPGMAEYFQSDWPSYFSWASASRHLRNFLPKQ